MYLSPLIHAWIFSWDKSEYKWTLKCYSGDRNWPSKKKDLSEHPGSHLHVPGNNAAKGKMAFCPIPQPSQRSTASQHINKCQRNSARGHIQETSEDKLTLRQLYRAGLSRSENARVWHSFTALELVPWDDAFFWTASSMSQGFNCPLWEGSSPFAGWWQGQTFVLWNNCIFSQ